MSHSIILDTQLIVLLTVVQTNSDIIRKHKNLTEFTDQDSDLLTLLVGAEPKLVLLPNTVSEAANLLRQHRDPERSSIMETFRNFVHSHYER